MAVETGVANQENIADVLPEGILTEGGTVTADELLPKAIVKPPAGATPVKATLPNAELCPTIWVGETVIAVSLAASIVSFELKVIEPNSASIAAVAFALIGIAVAVKWAEVVPAGTVIVAGSVTEASDDLREIATPPDPAFSVRVTVPVVELPPTTVADASEIRERDCPKPIERRQAQSNPIAINRLPIYHPMLSRILKYSRTEKYRDSGV